MSDSPSEDRTAAADEGLTEQSAYEVLRSTFAEVESWLHQPLYRPEPGSQLFDDDRDWPPLPPSQLAKAGLNFAAEHLWTVQVLIKANQLQPTAFRSVLRTALVGATQTVWLLAPDDAATRASRARMLLVEMYRRHDQYLEQLLMLDDPDEVTRRNTQIARDAVQERAEQIAQLRADAGERAVWKDTLAVRAAAAAAFASAPQPDQMVEEIVSEWMAGSGAAHGLLWPLAGTAGSVPVGEPDEHGRVTVEARGSVLRVANSYMAAFHMARHGRALLDRRGSVASPEPRK